MRMISDQERREVAAKLREKKKDFFGVRSFFPQDIILYRSLYMQAIDECLPDGDCCFDGLADLIDRPTCRNVYDETEMGACENGFECSECGNRVEDLEHCCITGTFNCCPKCEREVAYE